MPPVALKKLGFVVKFLPVAVLSLALLVNGNDAEGGR